MRLTGSRCRFLALVAVFLVTVAGMSLVAAGPGASSMKAAAAEGAVALEVRVDRSLSTVGESVTLSLKGRLDRSLLGAKLVVRVKGPAAPAQIGEAVPQLVEVHKYVKVLGEAPPPPTTTTTSLDAEEVTPSTSSTTTTTGPAVDSGTGELGAGAIQAGVVLEAGMPSEPGAYLLVVEVKSGEDVWARGQVWIGKALPRETPLDLALVWPVALGIHRDAEGVYYNQVLEEAVASESGDLRGLATLPPGLAGWGFTLALEPVLLTQLRDMADGYVRRDQAGNRVTISRDSPEARNAAATIDGLKALTAGGTAEIAVGPYSGADLSLLAAEGWRDGFDQVQMGKQELQQTLGLGAPLVGACSPDLGLTTDSLGYYAAASIDHLVVSSDLVGLLTEQIEDGAVAVRARDADNDRLTLVFADGVLGGAVEAVTATGDPGVFCATLAAQLAESPRDAVVVAPTAEFRLLPVSTLRILAEALEQTGWIDAKTVSGLLRSHSPGTRPILLQTQAGRARGYIQESLWEELRAAHAAAADLAAIADSTRAPLETAQRLLLVAQSRWWSRAGISPQEATVGLAYSRRARELAEGELGKVRLAMMESGAIIGRRGVVGLQILNDAGYPLTVDVLLGGVGLALADGEELKVEAAPGKTEIRVRVESLGGPHSLSARLVAGGRTLDQVNRSLRFITINTVLPAFIVGGLGILVGLFFGVRRLLRGRRTAPAAAVGGTPPAPSSPRVPWLRKRRR